MFTFYSGIEESTSAGRTTSCRVCYGDITRESLDELLTVIKSDMKTVKSQMLHKYPNSTIEATQYASLLNIFNSERKYKKYNIFLRCSLPDNSKHIMVSYSIIEDW